jgi:phosphate transport system substrate-binding protein
MLNSRSCSRWCSVAIALAWACAASADAQKPVADPHVIRVWGYTGLSAQLMRWEGAYQVLHPEIRFENELHGAAAVMAGLYNGVADVALMGREIWPVDTMAYRWVYQQQPFGVVVATAGLHAPGQLFTPVVIVNARNPLGSISVAQLDAIYGSEHRVAPANIRIWGDLGVQGEWADKPIHPYGFGGEDALGVFFRHDVLKMDFKPNPASHLLSDHDAGTQTAAQRIAQAVAGDPYAIGYTEAPQDAKTKVIAIASPAPIEPSEGAVAGREYGLTRSVWIYFERFTDKPLDPKVDGFVRFVLSERAQALVKPSDELLPLPTAVVKKQLQKLDSPMPPATATDDQP